MSLHHGGEAGVLALCRGRRSVGLPRWRLSVFMAQALVVRRNVGLTTVVKEIYDVTILAVTTLGSRVI